MKVYILGFNHAKPFIRAIHVSSFILSTTKLFALLSYFESSG